MPEQRFLIQQDLKNSSIFVKLKLTLEQRWNTIRSYPTREEAEAEYQKLLVSKHLDNKRCPLRMIEYKEGDVISFLRAKTDV